VEAVVAEDLTPHGPVGPGVVLDVVGVLLADQGDFAAENGLVELQRRARLARRYADAATRTLPSVHRAGRVLARAATDRGRAERPLPESPTCLRAGCYRRIMTAQELENLAHLRRARDLIDREYAKPLDVPTMARSALMSPAHFSRRFRAAYGETPYSYLMTRRIERAMALLRAGVNVTDACMTVGCTSLGSFSSRFSEVVGESPTGYRNREHAAVKAMPACLAKTATRPVRNTSSRNGEATGEAAA
jgi:AraC-like DNA-binding protein